MTPQELSNDIAATSIAEFGDTGVAMYPSKYFNHNVLVIAPDGSKTQRMPKYCATPFGASALAEISKPQSIVLGNAINFSGLLGSWQDTELVPYLQFVNPAAGSKNLGVVNAGTLLDYFNHGYPVAKVMADVKAEIEGAF